MSNEEALALIREARAKRAAEVNAASASEVLDLDELEALCNAATPGPWYARFLDDDLCMNLRAVSTAPDTGQHEHYTDLDESTMVAVTLLQSGVSSLPDRVEIADEREDQNTIFIARARTAMPLLLKLVRDMRLRYDFAPLSMDVRPDNFKQQRIERLESKNIKGCYLEPVYNFLSLHDAWDTRWGFFVDRDKIRLSWDDCRESHADFIWYHETEMWEIVAEGHGPPFSLSLRHAGLLYRCQSFWLFLQHYFGKGTKR